MKVSSGPLICLSSLLLAAGCGPVRDQAHKLFQKVSSVRLAPSLRTVVHPVLPGDAKLPADAALVDATERVNASYYYLLGKRLSAEGRADEALVAFERVRSLDPESAMIH